MIGATPLSLVDLGLASLLLVINGGISLAFRLGLERTLAIAAVRMVVQLALIGYVLQFVFQQSSALWTVLVALVMVAVAAVELRARQSRPFVGHVTLGLGAATLLVVGTLVTTLVTGAVIGASPWYAPSVFLPILGMVLGNALTGMALTLETLTQTAASERQGIEARLALGHSRLDAFRTVLGRALSTAMMPIINAMAVAGIVSLPGMMTGQILAGIDPVEAAKYQIMIMFAIAGASGLAVVAAAVGGVLFLTDQRLRLRLDRLSRRPAQ